MKKPLTFKEYLLINTGIHPALTSAWKKWQLVQDKIRWTVYAVTTLCSLLIALGLILEWAFDMVPRDTLVASNHISYDQGKIDGCQGKWNYFWNDSLPEILPLMLFAIAIAWMLHGFGFIIVRR